MEVVIGETAGFCFGVENAVTKAKKELDRTKPVYCLGELVHNNQVTDELIQKGIIFIDEVNLAKGKLIIRSHGVSKKIYEAAKNRDIELIDLTCPKVLKIHSIVEKYANNGYYILLVGQSGHDETIGTASYCGEHYSVIEDSTHVRAALEGLEKSNIKDVLLICQTTFNLEIFHQIASMVEKEVVGKNLEIINTICDATKERQAETIQIAGAVDLMIIIGSKSSSNTNKLYEISKKYCENVMLIETKNELKKEYVEKINKVGIMAGASTPKKSIQEVVEILNQI